MPVNDITRIKNTGLGLDRRPSTSVNAYTLTHIIAWYVLFWRAELTKRRLKGLAVTILTKISDSYLRSKLHHMYTPKRSTGEGSVIVPPRKRMPSARQRPLHNRSRSAIKENMISFRKQWHITYISFIRNTHIWRQSPSKTNISVMNN